MELSAFAESIGADGPVTIVGSGSRGGGITGVRSVSAPAGIERVEPDEMVVECGAGTPIAELQAALGPHQQRVCIPEGGTVGGALAVGQSGIRRLGDGPVRDTLLQARFVNAAGEVVTVGGPTVKNVSGFDLCRLLVGSRGILGFIGSVVLRTRPLAPFSQWYQGSVSPREALVGLYRSTSLLWDGETVWALLEGHPDDVQEQATRLGLVASDAPDLPTAHRWSLPPSTLTDQPDLLAPGPFVAELGVGIVHHDRPAPAREIDPAVAALNARVKQLFDPTGRLNPGLDLLDGV